MGEIELTATKRPGYQAGPFHIKLICPFEAKNDDQ